MAALSDRMVFQKRTRGATNNYAYFPVLLESEAHVRKVIAQLNEQGVLPRRYFSPSLDCTSLYGPANSPMSQDIAIRILCLPIYAEAPAAHVANALEIEYD